MGFRLLRIFSDEAIFEQRLKELKNNFLISRNYNSKLIDAEFEKVKSYPGNSFEDKRREALKKIIRKPKDQTRVIAPVDYNPHLAKASQVFQKHHKAMLISAPHLKEIFPSPPMPAYRQPDNIRKILCKSTL